MMFLCAAILSSHESVSRHIVTTNMHKIRCGAALPNSASTPEMPANTAHRSPQKVDFTAQYKKGVRAYIDELEEYFIITGEF
jgi:hypothetical protein